MLRSQRLKLVTQYAADRDALLRDYLDQGGAYKAPAQALPDIVRQLGWRIAKEGLPQDRLCECCPASRTITIAGDLRARLDYPSSTRSVAYSLLAHELGHVRLHAHQAHQGPPPRRWEEEARLYALVFCLPWNDVERSDHWRILKGNLLTPERRWAPLYHLAREFEVTPSFAGQALAAYGVLKFDGDKNPFVPNQTLCSRAYSLSAGRNKRNPRAVDVSAPEPART